MSFVNTSLIAPALTCALISITLQANGADFGTFEKPFSATSLWNSKPVAPVFDDFVIPTSKFFPAVQDGKYSTHCYLAKESDGPMIVKGTIGKKGIYDADAENFNEQITIPHWPSELLPAEGTDGHADIFDTTSGVIYSFWQLKKNEGEWRATHYGWMPMSGSGWGDPAHYHQGSRATGIASCAGIIRTYELYDRQDMYNHALAISLTDNALSHIPSYTYPATVSDGNTSMNTGLIPEGALLMLPPEFDTALLKTPELKKIANTLKVYGAYVVDKNYGTPYVIYAEIGSGLKMHKGIWDVMAAQELQSIRKNLRMVRSTDGWIDGNGQAFTPNKNLNILSMRGPWVPLNGKLVGKFFPTQQAVVFDKTETEIVQANYSPRSIPLIDWAKPEKGQRYTLKAITTGGAKLRFKLIDKQTNKITYDSRDLNNKDTVSFTWPSDDSSPILTATSGVGSTSSVSGLLIKETNK